LNFRAPCPPPNTPTRGAYIGDEADILSLFPLYEEIFEDVFTGDGFGGSGNIHHQVIPGNLIRKVDINKNCLLHFYF
tara:strand:- start:1231 stop:1461 length:231 start_codon:yes stop_codon:yes gene_type:complete